MNKKDNIEVSIIVPVYNASSRINKCVNSILEQSLKNIEIVLINDGSKDNSGKICDEIAKKDSRVKVIHQKNQGCSVARNNGIQNVRGDYIGFVDADDYIEKDMYEDMYSLAKKTDADIVETGTKSINKKKIIDIFSKEKLTPDVWNKIFKRELIKREKIFFPLNTSMGEDFVFVTKSELLSKKIGRTVKAHYYYEQFENGLSQNLEKRFDIFISINEILSFLEKISNEKKEKISTEEMIFLHGFIYPLSIIGNRKGFFRNIKRLLMEVMKYKKYFSLKTKIKMLYILIITSIKYLYKFFLKRIK